MTSRIVVGIDDTDVVGSRGTNQLARSLVAQLGDCCRCVRIVRHQLLEDPRVPCTTKNGSASITLDMRDGVLPEEIADRLRRQMLDSFTEGSDPGLCVAAGSVPEAVTQFGRRCQCELISQQDAHRLAMTHGIRLEGLGGSNDGVIGALAAVGLEATRNDGRIVQLGQWPDDLSGIQPLQRLHQRGLEVRILGSDQVVRAGHVDVGKHLRPNRREDRDVLFVERNPGSRAGHAFVAVKLP